MPRPRVASERAFTLIEVVIVLLITMIAIATMLMTRNPNGSAAGRAGAVSAARVLGDAIEDFRKDHGGRPPVISPTSRDWPSDTVRRLNRGPVNTYTGRVYLRNRPVDVLENGSTRVVNGAGSAPAPVRFVLQYFRDPARPGGWAIVVRDQRGIVRPCFIRGGSIAVPSGVSQPC